MKIILILFIVTLAAAAFLILLGILRTWQVQHSSNEQHFLKGKIPNELPDGFYKGHARGYTGPWQGKTFSRKTHTGANVFANDAKQITMYPFTTSVGTGLQDKHHQVIKIEYNNPQNSFWVRMILDEIVEIKPNVYLGKINVRLIPFLPFSIGYFTLEK